MFYEPQALIVVYKDELLANQLKKLVETKDDIDEEKTVGTPDSKEVTMEYNQRGHHLYQMLAMNAETGKLRIVVEERAHHSSVVRLTMFRCCR